MTVQKNDHFVFPKRICALWLGLVEIRLNTLAKYPFGQVY